MTMLLIVLSLTVLLPTLIGVVYLFVPTFVCVVPEDEVESVITPTESVLTPVLTWVEVLMSYLPEPNPPTPTLCYIC